MVIVGRAHSVKSLSVPTITRKYDYTLRAIHKCHMSINYDMLKWYHKIYATEGSWLRVPHNDIRIAGIEEHLSSHSYRNAHFVWLHDPVDMLLFVTAMETKTFQINIESFATKNWAQYAKTQNLTPVSNT